MPLNYYVPSGILQASPSTIVDVGDYVLGPGIPLGTTVINITNMGSYILIELSQVPWTDSVVPAGVVSSGSGFLEYTGYYSNVVFRKNQSPILAPSKTVSFHEDTKGWVSFKSFEPESAISMANDYYTFFNGNLYEHHIETVNRNTFYAIDNSIGDPFTPSSIDVVLNDNPSNIKEFNTLNYEGSQSKVDKFTFIDSTDPDYVPIPFQTNTDYDDQEYYNLYAKKGWFVESIITNEEDGDVNEFLEKEGKWFNYIKREIDLNLQEADTGDFSFQGIGFADTITPFIQIGMPPMTILRFNNLMNLNVSLQVGDGVYARNAETQPGADDPQASSSFNYNNLSTGVNHYAGILRRIDDLSNNQYDLYVDDNVTSASYTPGINDFIMFSKFSQGDSGVLGYYAKAKFVNDSEEKAELFAVSSEIIITSK